MNTVGGQKVHVAVVNETNAIEIGNLQVRSMSSDFRDVDHFIDFFLSIITKFECSCLLTLKV